ncbi:MAG TPA: hypothetical protein VGN13_05460 [Solirubrobacteraceae bacterium]|jgi:hypothetical protein
MTTIERSIDGTHLVRLVATENGTCAEKYLDERDQEIVDTRMGLMNLDRGPRVGDWVIFADGTQRRISHDWRSEDGWDGGFQTSEGGSWYLSVGGCSFSGALHPSIPKESLTDTGEMRDGQAWIFHHDRHTAHNGVNFMMPFRVFKCSLPANR